MTLMAALTVSLLLTVDGRTTPVSLLVELDRRAQADRWADALVAITRYADEDRNGVIDANEARRVPSALRVRQLGWGYLWAVPQPVELGSNTSQDDLAAYYRRHLANGPQIGIGQTPPASLLTDALVKHLDANKDGRLDEAEWKNAESALRPLDADDDELIRPGELVARTVYPGSAGGLMLPPTAATPLPKPLTDFPVVRRPPGNEPRDRILIAVRLGTRKPGIPEVDQAADDPPGVRPLVYGVPSTLMDDFATARKSALDRFAAADTNADAALDAAEVKTAGYAPLRDHFHVADRDIDGRLTRTEWEAYLTLRGTLVAAQATVTLFDHGRGLFEALDADGDCALSVRELRTAWQRLTAAGCVRDGRLTLDKLPHTLRIVASRGRPSSLACTPERTGPDWFRAMDRNRDGDVSRREFVGPADAFTKLDTDADGLLSAAEAMAGKK